MLKKLKEYFLSPLFAPISAVLLCSLSINIIYVFMPFAVPEISEEGQLIDILTYVGYGILFTTLIFVYKDFKTKKCDYFVYIALFIFTLLREIGAQHWLTKTDTTAIKIKFFTNPNNPLHEKIIAFLIVLLVLSLILYLAIKYTKYLIKSFFKMDTISWSVGTLIFFGLFSKFVDRFPSNYKREHGEWIAETIKNNLSILEETSEIFLPLIAIVILLQNHLILKDKK